MPPFLADFPAPSNNATFEGVILLAALITTGSAFLAGIYYWRKISGPKEKSEPRESKIIDQPVQVELTKTFVTKEELHQLETRHGEELKKLGARIDGMDRQIEENFRALDAKRSESINGLHKRIEAEGKGTHTRIDAVLEAVSNLAGYVKGKIG